MSVDLGAVLNEHRRNVGFREGPNNTNPWGPEQGVNNAAYCDSGQSMVAYHNGYRWWPESQCGEKGCAYCPFHINVGEAHGEVRYDHASRGDPADILAGDLLFYDWNNNGVADHVEGAIEDCPSNGRSHNVGYNTGSPEGCHDLWRDRTYLLCRLRPAHYRDGVPSPQPKPSPQPGPVGHPWSGRFLRNRMVGNDVRSWQQRMMDRGWHLGVDGEYGPESSGVCRGFQHEKALEVDGIVGPQTWVQSFRTDNLS